MKDHRGMMVGSKSSISQEKEPLPQPQGSSRDGQVPWDRGHAEAGVSGDTVCVTPEKRSFTKGYRAC